MPKIIEVPGSKSITNRVLILAVLAKGTTIIKNAAICDDTKYMVQGLKKLGIKISQKGKIIKIQGCAAHFTQKKTPIRINCGNAGTTTRFLTALATLTGNTVIIDGNKRMQERPIKALTKALNQLGAKIKDSKGYLPITIFPQKLKGGEINLPGNISSQYISALLMTAPLSEKTTSIKIDQKLYSKPYIKTTIEALKSFNIKIVNKNFRQFIVKPASPTSPKTYTVESDASSASYIGAFAALHSKKILLKNIHEKSIQGDIKFLQYLKKMGCKIFKKKDGTLIEGPKLNKKTNHTNLKNLGTIDMNETPDLVMTFAILAVFAPGKTKITNIENLRIKETDRIQALENELKKLSVKVKTGKNWIKIEGTKNINFWDIPKKNYHNTPHIIQHVTPITIKTYNDHRIAMSFGIAQTVFRNIKIKNPNCVSKSYTTFWEDLASLKSNNA